MSWDRFDICAAYWCFAYCWHEGQGSDTYAILGRLERLRFRPSPLWSGSPCDLPSVNARAIYQQLVERRCGRWSTVNNPNPNRQS